MSRTVILGIETSCDETAAALVIDGKLAADRTTRQVLHERYGGVVPELASRAHERLLSIAVDSVLGDTGLTVQDISAVAVTHGPGLAGALLVGVSFAKGLSQAAGIPLIGVNHLEGHLWSVELTHDEIPLPFLGLIVSGGHTLLVRVLNFGRYELLGSTRDDAVGELFDKTGRMIGFSFPSGADLDRAGNNFDGQPVHFPRAKLSGDPYSFSFSGLKTSVLYYLQQHYESKPGGVEFILSPQARSAVAAGIMDAVGDMLSASMEAALSDYDYEAIVLSGGVAASRHLRGRFHQLAKKESIPMLVSPIEHCTDNGAMIAHVGMRKFAIREFNSYDLSIEPSAKLTD